MTKQEGKRFFEHLTAQHSSLPEVLFTFDHNYKDSGMGDEPYTGDLTCDFGMDMLGMALEPFSIREIRMYGWQEWKDRYDENVIAQKIAGEYYAKRDAERKAKEII